MTDQNQPLVVSSLSESCEELQLRFQQYGYLYFKNAIATEVCQGVLDDIIEQCEPYVGKNAAGKPVLLQQEGFGETDAVWDKIYPKVQSLESFHNFFHRSDVESLMKIVAGDNVFPYPMKMARIATPGKRGYETPPHQDGHSHQADGYMSGMWVALQDINQAMGRLKLLPFSHKRGIREVYQADGVGNVQCEIFDDETVWHVSDVGQGDVIIFHAFCVHKAEPNLTQHDVRFSIDTRFSDYGSPVFVTNFQPHHGWRIDGLDWQNIYRHWKSDELQYYWKDYPEVFDTLLER